MTGQPRTPELITMLDNMRRYAPLPSEGAAALFREFIEAASPDPVAEWQLNLLAQIIEANGWAR